MLSKTLRVLIADEQHFNRMKIERDLNQLRYFRIAPVHHLEELLTLVEYGCEPFDLLIISAAFVGESQFDLLAFCLDNPQINHAFIYDGQHLEQSQVLSRRQQKIQLSQQQLPDRESLRRLMAWVDPLMEQASLSSQRKLHAF
ncbi:hypothetical protein [Pseudomonas sp. CF161]|jgi:hypothetical protein|uniref:hypothetical protein n=1 Tax=Pseudomonas sp. CF161 TaxID=911241 RepID=UPI000425852D|nr:hypothetical protein [Pseudomonas sp. CF161]